MPGPDTFCILPWTNLMVAPDGVAQICCAAAQPIRDGAGDPVRVDVHDADSIWNGPHLRGVRQRMLAGEVVADCESCAIAEAANGASMRTLQNRLYFGADRAAEARFRSEARHRDGRVAGLPAALHLTVSNLCNLTCRMCFGGYSSQIAADPVLSRWAPGWPERGAVPAAARIVTRRIGPAPALGVCTTGFGAPVAQDDWPILGTATLDLPVAWFEKPLSLHLATHAETAAPLRVEVDGRTLFDGMIDATGMHLDLDVSWLPDAPVLAVTLRGAARLRSIALRLVVADAATRAAGKPGQRPSANHAPAIETLLANPALAHVNFTGGEPMLMPEVAEAVAYLIATGRAADMSVSLATNATRVDDALLDGLTRFRSLSLFVSIDGVGPLFEYIRPPARWSRVAENVEALAGRVGPARVFLHPTVQAYNLLGIVDVCRFADRLGVGIELLDILISPRRLAVEVMPPAARAQALSDLRAYRATECRAVNRRPVDDLIAHLERTLPIWRIEHLPEFRRFTAELDAVHRQDFRQACPELAHYLDAAQPPGKQ